MILTTGPSTAITPTATFHLHYQAACFAEMGDTVLATLQNGVSAVTSAVSLSPNSLDNHSSDVQGLLSKLLTVPLTSVYISLAALSITAGAAAYLTAILSSKNRHVNTPDQAAKDCLLIMSPTPFNRYVLMRCPSIVFEEADAYEWLTNTLCIEGRHPVDENWAGTLLRVTLGNDVPSRFISWDNLPTYQRTFLYAEDGGVLAIDWPSHLELSGEHGLDTTFLLIPGSADGSGDKCVQTFVQRSLKCGCFPIVLNPRGCGGSPLTTPRLYTAGDSDDVHLAIHFIMRSRPGVAIMSVGWGYGANMLLKYLGEEKEATRLTAAVCIGDTFELEESTNSFRHGQGPSFNQEMIKGFVQILKANQIVFEGRTKGFDVQKGLSAKSIGEFDTVISRVAHGFDTLEAFYENASSRSWIDKVKIPLLCIQNHDTTSSILSIPSHVFEENSFITLITLRSRSWDLQNGSSFQTVARGCDNLIIEWLAAVELAFLKGHHPLLQGPDPTFKSPKEWSSFRQYLASPQQSAERKEINPSGNGSNLDQNRPYTGKHYWELWGSNGATHQQSVKKNINTTNELPKVMSSTEKEKPLERIPIVEVPDDPIVGDLEVEKAPCEAGIREDAAGISEGDAEMERSHARQAAETVMNVMDITMPGTLSDKQKQKVLDGVERGETIITALQEACPEEVREKMATSVSAAVQARGISLKLVGSGENMPAPGIPAGMKEKIQDKLNLMVKSKSSSPKTTSTDEFPQPDLGSESKNGPVENVNSFNNQSENSVQSTEAKRQIGMADENQTETSEHKAGTVSEDDLAVAEKPLGLTSEIPDGVAGQAQGQIQKKEMQPENSAENRSLENQKESGAAKQDNDTMSIDKEGRSVEVVNQNNSLGNQDLKTDKPQENYALVQPSGEAGPEISGTEKKTEALTNSVSGQDDPKTKALGTDAEEVSSSQTSLQSSIPLQSIDMRQAFEALTGVDDSTQMAVTNVFGVIENVLEQLEKEHNQKEQHLTQPTDREDHQGSLTEERGIELEPEKHIDESPEDASVNSINENDCPGLCSGHDCGTTNDAEIVASTEDEAYHGGSEFVNATGLVSRSNSPIITGATTEVLSKQFAQTSSHGNMEPCRDTRRLQCENRNLDQTLVKKNQNIFTNIPSEGFAPQKDLASEIPNDGDDEDVAMEYFEEENIWKFISNTLDPKVRVKRKNNFDGKSDTVQQDRGESGVFDAEESDKLSEKIMYNPVTLPSNEIPHVIEPSYIILDDDLKIPDIQTVGDDIQEGHHENTEFLGGGPVFKKDTQKHGEGVSECCLRNRIRDLIVDALNLELVQRLGDSAEETLGVDLDKEITRVANAVAETSILVMPGNKQEMSCIKDQKAYRVTLNAMQLQETGKMVLHAETIVRTVNHVYSDTAIFGRIIPAYVLVGVILASLRPLHFVLLDDMQKDPSSRCMDRKELSNGDDLFHFLTSEDICLSSSSEMNNQASSTCKAPWSVQKCDLRSNASSLVNTMEVQIDSVGGLEKIGHLMSSDNDFKDSFEVQEEWLDKTSPVNKPVMDAVAAAMGASERPGITSSSSAEQGNHKRFDYEIEESFFHKIDDGKEGDDNKTSIVSSFAEKALSMAAPVVPTKQDGGVDHDRLVAILAGLGQKGGILRYIGKVALLWGGLRGAMSLTDRLLGFLHISDRPLYQRLLGFVAMALLLWSPVVVPLLPTLLQQWASKSVGGVAKTAAVTGLYGAIVILVTIWGRKIRGYDSPLSQYGLKLFPYLKARQLQSLTSGLALGFSLVTSFYVIGIFLGLIDFSWATTQYLDASKTIISNVLSCWRIVKLVVWSLVMGVAISVIEELLFRSWLHEEIAVDLGFHKAAVLSGLFFSVSHWSLPVVPGLWLLSFVLAGARVRCNGDLDLAIGIHTGIIAGNRIINTGGFVKYATTAPHWITGAQAGNLLGGLLGISIIGIIALFFYPWDHVWRQKHLELCRFPSSTS